MKKNLFLGLGVAAMMLATSCSQDDFGNGSLKTDGEEANVVLNVSTPTGINSRKFSDGKTAQKLQWKLYEVKGTTRTKVDGNDADNIELNKTMNFKLITGHKYGIVLWAESTGTNPYEVTMSDDGTATMTVTYDNNVKANDENLDAFYSYQEFDVTGDISLNIPMYRPFAQINVGTNDLDAEVVAGKSWYTSVKVSQAYKTLDLIAGAVTGSPEEVIFNTAAIPTSTVESFPVDNYDYMSMVYVLVEQNRLETNAGKNLVNVTFNYGETAEGTDAKSREITNVPVQQNYRTNIYGQILTSNAELNVYIVPGYDGTTEGVEYTDLDILAQNGGELTLSHDINVDHDIVLGKTSVIDFNGNNIISKNGHTVTIGEQAVSRAEEITVTLKGKGSFEPNLIVNKGNLVIEDGTYTGEDAIKNINGTVSISGGSFVGFDVPADFVAGENHVIEGEDSEGKKVSVVVSEDVPESAIVVTETTLTNALTKEGYLVLAEDTEASKRLVRSKSGTIDFNGNTLTSEVNESDAMVITTGNTNDAVEVTIKNGTFIGNGTNASYGVIAVQKNPSVIIEDVYIEGVNPIMMYSTGNGTITINSGTFISKGAQAVYYYKGAGKITINGGVFKAEPYNGIYYTLNIKDDMRPASGDVRDAIEVRGGKFYNFNPANNKAEGEGTNFVADGYKVISYQEGADTVYEVVKVVPQ